MKTETKDEQNFSDDDLICPITQEIFRDPVRAADGFVYERDAISRWILQKGTSPLTRKPLRIDELRPDEKIRHLARRRRRSTVSYDARNDTVSLPPLRLVPRATNQISPIPVRPCQTVPRVPRVECSKKRMVKLLFLLFSICTIVGPIVGMVLGLAVETPINDISVYSNVFNNTNVTFSDVALNKTYYYETIQVVVVESSSYIFTSSSNIDTYGRLYMNNFNNTNPANNLLIYDDNNSGRQQQFRFKIVLTSGTYILVVATFTNATMQPFSIIVTGTQFVNVVLIIPLLFETSIQSVYVYNFDHDFITIGMGECTIGAVTYIMVAGLGSIITGIVGTVLYSKARDQQYEYNTRTPCLLLNKISNETCNADNSDRSFRQVTPSLKDCYYDEWFFVNYPTSDGTWLNSTIHETMSSAQRPVEIGQTYPCFYSRKDGTSVIWQQDSHITGKIMLIAGWTGAIISLLCWEPIVFHLIDRECL
ncbi:unnamed protein product [Rotaria socialis]|uniref:U-box domain-containing protein n=2 Tax=Rotaria socialis TaxID=392032 RepID=A0A817P3D0_9BILA|nr:unnamed protein product [Rotaria socialis]